MSEIVTLETLAQGAHCGLKGDAYTKAITTQKEFKGFWKEYSSRSYPPEAMPKVDFHNEMVLVAYGGLKSSSGYSVALSAQSDGDSLEVYVQRESPQKGAIGLTVMTQPHHIVKAPKFKTVNFHEKCCGCCKSH